MKPYPLVLGISASHNGSACLLRGDEIVVAVQEERLTRVKRARVNAGTSFLAARYCLAEAKVTAANLDMIVCSGTEPQSTRDDVRLNPDLRPGHYGTRVEYIAHHAAHAISTFATSGFDDAAVLVVDGNGSPIVDLPEDERAVIVGGATHGRETISAYVGRGASLTPVSKHVTTRPWYETRTSGMPIFRSLGGMFSAVAQQIFGNPMEAGKVMGLAPYGVVTRRPEEFFRWRGDELEFCPDVALAFEGDARWPAREREYADLAASCQLALEEALLEICRKLRAATGSRALCLAGGVALNSVANERIVREAGFERVFILPAAEDSGPAIGAAYYGLWKLTHRNSLRRLTHDGLGATYDDEAADRAIATTPAVCVERTSNWVERTVDRLCAGEIVGWFQGRSELGPRSLGQRSILCDPRREDGKEVLNRRVKHREAFRPFAPAILRDSVADWFETVEDEESPFMLRVLRFREEMRARVPAVVHVDGTGRVQTLTREANGPFFDLVSRFHARTGVPILLNTSYNVMGEPIVETPDDALFSLLYTGIDCCVFRGRLVTKEENFRSLLDLYPRLIAASYSIVKHLHGGASRAVASEDVLSFRVELPWGPSQSAVKLGVLPLVEHINGRRSGWDLLELVGQGNDRANAESLLKATLGTLWRGRVISVARGPEGGVPA